MDEDEKNWDGLDPWRRPEVRAPEPLRGEALLELPRNWRRWLAISLAVPGFFIVAFLLLTMGPFADIGPGSVATGLIMVLIFVILAFVIAYAYMYMIIYPDRVVIRRVTYDLSDILWLDVYEVEDMAGYTEIGRATIPHIVNYFELVFSVQTPAGTKQFTFRNKDSELDLTVLIDRLQVLLPDLKVERHVGVDDRTGGPFWLIVNAMGGR